MTPRESPKPTPPKSEPISRSNYPASIKAMIESDLAKRLRDIEFALQRARERLEQFEEKYQWSTETFVELFTSDRLQHNLDFYEWLAEVWMLEKLQEKRAMIQNIEFFNC